MKLVPEPKEAPPEAAAYQLTDPVLAAAPKFTVPFPQREPAVVELIVGVVFTVANTDEREPVVHPFAVAST